MCRGWFLAFGYLLFTVFVLVIPLFVKEYESPEVIVYMGFMFALIIWFSTKMFASSSSTLTTNHENNISHGNERRQSRLAGAATVWAEREQYRQSSRMLALGRRAEAARWVMRALPPVRSFNAEETNESQNECSICMEEFKKGELIQPFGVCVHQFHASCVNSWLLGGKTTCPVCRKDLATTLPLEAH